MEEAKKYLIQNLHTVDFDIDKIADAIYKASQVLDSNEYEVASYFEDYLTKIEREQFEANKEIGRLYYRSIITNITNSETIEYIKNNRFYMFLKRLLQKTKPIYHKLLQINGFIGVLRLIKVIIELFIGNHASKYRVQNSY